MSFSYKQREWTYIGSVGVLETANRLASLSLPTLSMSSPPDSQDPAPSTTKVNVEDADIRLNQTQKAATTLLSAIRNGRTATRRTHDRSDDNYTLQLAQVDRKQLIALLSQTLKYVLISEGVLEKHSNARELLKSYVLLIDTSATLLDFALGERFEEKRAAVLG